MKSQSEYLKVEGLKKSKREKNPKIIQAMRTVRFERTTVWMFQVIGIRNAKSAIKIAKDETMNQVTVVNGFYQYNLELFALITRALVG
jgi:hypothetical protein